DRHGGRRGLVGRARSEVIPLAQTLLDGLVLGGVFAFAAVGFSLIFGVLGVVNLSHGVFVVLGAYLGLMLHEAVGIDPLLGLPVVMGVLALIGYAVGLAALILVKILAPGFYARQNLKTPVKVAVVTVLVTQALALTLMWPLGHAGLTLATSLGAFVNAGLLLALLLRRGHYRPRPGWVAFASRVVVALGVLAAVLVWSAGPAAGWLQASLWGRVGHLAGVVAAGAGAYFATLWLLGFRLADFSRRDADAPPDGPGGGDA
ncbi:MAG: polysaccharide biosynthesis C-terminal domain-containing protein, partial [Burkholderiales bacterium]|nr:polysaccharide biosynthesis C-terminal domain-containing protein [Burkholderiales bacterium]